MAARTYLVTDEGNWTWAVGPLDPCYAHLHNLPGYSRRAIILPRELILTGQLGSDSKFREIARTSEQQRQLVRALEWGVQDTEMETEVMRLSTYLGCLKEL